MGGIKARGWWPLLAVLTVPAALAQVTLETEVSKVVTTLDSAGRVERQLEPVQEVVPGEELRYTITFENESNTPVAGERIVITNPIPDGTVYVGGSAGGEDSLIEYSTDGETWTEAQPGAAAAPADPAAGDPDEAFAPLPAAAADGRSPVRSLRWTYTGELAPGASDSVFFHVRML